MINLKDIKNSNINYVNIINSFVQEIHSKEENTDLLNNISNYLLDINNQLDMYINQEFFISKLP